MDAEVMTAMHREAAPGGEPSAGVVLGLTEPMLALLAARSVARVAPRRLRSIAFMVNVVLTGATVEMYVQSVAAQLLHEVRRIDDKPEEFLAEMAAAGHPIFALLYRSEGLTTEILRGLANRFPGVC